MTLDQFRSMIRLQVPGAKAAVITDANLDILINKGVDDVNSFTQALQGDKQFNAIAEQQEYNISSEVADNFFMMDEGGIWWNEGTTTSPRWKELFPKTDAWLTRYRPQWREEGSGDPEFYIVKRDIIRIIPKPSASLTNGFWIYYIKTAPNMTVGENYPFTNTTTEITAFRDLDDAIIDYVRWKLARPLGKDNEGTISEGDYYKNLSTAKLKLNRRPDIKVSRWNRMRTPFVRRP